MSAHEKLAVVVPTYREAECLPQLLARLYLVLSQLGIPFEILVVDDDSRDGTEQCVAALAEKAESVRLLVRKGERGLAGAVLHGWQHTDATLLAVLDADMQHPPELLRDLLSSIRQGHDLAIASRYHGPSGLNHCNRLRGMISAVSAELALPLQRASLRVRDPMSGYFIVRRRCLENVFLQTRGFKLLLEILTRGRIRSVVEVPFEFGRRTAGRSKAGIGVACDYLLLLARLYVERWRGRRVAESASD